MSTLRHATCVAIGAHGVLIEGPSGSGKSDLALRLIDRGALLVADDYTQVTREGDAVRAVAPLRIAGRIEVRGVGIVDMPFAQASLVRLIVALGEAGPRLPEGLTREVEGVVLPLLMLDGREATSAIKVEMTLKAVAA